MFTKNNREERTETSETKNVAFKTAMKEKCKPSKLASVAGIAVVGYVLEVGLKILTGTLTD